MRLQFYTVDELERVVTRAAGLLGLAISKDGAMEVARRARGTPRIAGRLLRRVRDFADVAGAEIVDARTADAALNSNCGNKTEIALREAERNFTMGIVAQFTTEGLPVGIVAGPLVLGICGSIATLFSIVWISG